MADDPTSTTTHDARQDRANVARANRDKLNDEARKWATKRDELNAKVRELVNAANEHRKQRDEHNESVQRHKKARDEASKEAEAAREHLAELRKERLPPGGRPLHVIKKDLQRLEFEQMTGVMTTAKERDLIERMKAVRAELKQKEATINEDPELKAAQEAYDAARAKSETAHHKVGETAEKAQSEHEKMVTLFGQTDKVRKEADRYQERFVAAKLEADRLHKEYIDIVNQIHEASNAHRTAQREASGEFTAERAAEINADADAIYERFKRGEKLSTEDLMTLQKAGLL